ncbi:hypothetical protein PUN28_014324 [Cardiocondyla obscurior]|uniref:Uncharacterized protein n=1 Tax=Cardiocondyla obscurior TaxID=286306 RepID=A0AAW2F3S9_9HYME
MFCEVRRSFARISPALCCSREREELLFGDFFRAPAIPCFRRPKKDPARELWYFARYAPRDVFPASNVSATHPVLFRPPLLSISPSYDLNSLDHIFAMFRPSNFRPPPIVPLSPRLLFPPFFPPATSAGTLVPPFAALIVGRPLVARGDSFNPVNQNSTRKRGQMYTMRGARTYRVSGTIASGHRFPPPGWDKCEDMLPENARRLISSLPRRNINPPRSRLKVTRLIYGIADISI